MEDDGTCRAGRPLLYVDRHDPFDAGAKRCDEIAPRGDPPTGRVLARRPVDRAVAVPSRSRRRPPSEHARHRTPSRKVTRERTSASAPASACRRRRTGCRAAHRSPAAVGRSRPHAVTRVAAPGRGRPARGRGASRDGDDRHAQRVDPKRRRSQQLLVDVLAVSAMCRTRSVAPRGKCRPAERRLAPLPTRSRSRTRPMPPVTESPARARSGVRRCRPDDGHARRSCVTPPTSVVPAYRRPLEKRRQLTLGPGAAQAVDDPLTAPRDQAEIGIRQPALLARRVLHEQAAVARPVPADREVAVDPVLVALARSRWSIGSRKSMRAGRNPVAQTMTSAARRSPPS